jgi:hypothetical protein
MQSIGPLNIALADDVGIITVVFLPTIDGARDIIITVFIACSLPILSLVVLGILVPLTAEKSGTAGLLSDLATSERTPTNSAITIPRSHGTKKIGRLARSLNATLRGSYTFERDFSR